ncbi:MAG: acetyl-CoA carboxylase biotin carboxyl carrier protein subunit [Burkholderiaceae bacterium]
MLRTTRQCNPSHLRRHKSGLLLQAHSVFAARARRSYIALITAKSLAMELRKIKQLIDVLADSDLTELKLVDAHHTVRLIRRVGTAPTRMPAPTEQAQSPPASTGALHSQPTNVADAMVDLNSGHIIVAPLFGVVHLAPAPDAPVFVAMGDVVQAGQTLCVMEAMKMFHEVKSPRMARVTAVLAESGQEANPGQPLFALLSVGAA